MTSSQLAPVPIKLGGRNLDVLLDGAAPELVGSVLQSLAEEIEVYGALPPEALSGDIAAVVERNLRLYIDALATGAPPSGSQLDEIAYSAARRAEERIPQELMLRAYPLAARVVYERVTRDIGPDDAEALRAITLLLLQFLEEVISTAAAGYLDAYQMIIGAAQSHEERVLGALLRGADGLVGDDLTGIEPPAAFDLFTIAIAEHPDEHEPGVDAAIAARRKLRRVRSELRRLSNDTILGALSPSGGIALLPVEASAAQHESNVLIDAITEAAGVPVTAATARAAPVDIPRAVDEVRAVLELVQWLGLPPSLYRLDDVLVEYQVTRPGPARVALGQRLAPIIDDAELVATLRRYLDEGGNRRRVALDLHIHPNTVDYRTAKITRLTGLDPTNPAHAYELRSALLAHDAEQHDADRP